MDIDEAFKRIKKLYSLLNNKDDEVSLIYKGTEHGVTKSWTCRIDSRTVNSEDHESALNQMISNLKKELESRANTLEKQANDFRKELSSFGN